MGVPQEVVHLIDVDPVDLIGHDLKQEPAVSVPVLFIDGLVRRRGNEGAEISIVWSSASSTVSVAMMYREAFNLV